MSEFNSDNYAVDNDDDGDFMNSVNVYEGEEGRNQYMEEI